MDLVLTLKFGALKIVKKTGFSPVKNTSQFFFTLLLFFATFQ